MSDDLSIPNPGYRSSNRAGRYGSRQGRIGQGMDPDTRRLTLFAGGLGAVLAMLIGASALIGHHSTEVPVVTADIRPIRVKPDNPGGMKIDGAENDVFSGGSDTANSRLAPSFESPNTKALRAEEAAPPPVVENTAPLVPAPLVPAPLVPAPADRSTATPTPAAVGRTTQTKPAIVANTSPAAKPAHVTNIPPEAKPAIVTTAPPVANALPAARAATIPAAKPAQATPVTAVEPHPSAPGPRALVQLGALGSEEAARNEWQQLLKRMPDLLNGHQPVFVRADRDGHVFWRLRTSGFADVAQARAFCERVRTKGGGCSIAEF